MHPFIDISAELVKMLTYMLVLSRHPTRNFFGYMGTVESIE